MATNLHRLNSNQFFGPCTDFYRARNGRGKK
jgi:hypothetical protein